MVRVDRRGFLRAGGQAVIGVAGILGGAPASFARVVTNAAKPKEAILGAETEIRRMFGKK
jgi:hypothetical protein